MDCLIRSEQLSARTAQVQADHTDTQHSLSLLASLMRLPLDVVTFCVSLWFGLWLGLACRVARIGLGMVVLGLDAVDGVAAQFSPHLVGLRVISKPRDFLNNQGTNLS